MRVELPRNGDVPLAFDGALIHEATAEPLSKFRNAYTLALYAVDGGGWVVHIRYTTENRYEFPANWTVGGPDDHTASRNLLEWIRAHDPATVLLGFPPGAQFEPGKKKAARRLTAMLESLANDLLPHMVDPL